MKDPDLLLSNVLSNRFDAILTRMPQAVVFLEDGAVDEPGGTPGSTSDQGGTEGSGGGSGVGPCLINPAAADLLELAQ